MLSLVFSGVTECEEFVPSVPLPSGHRIYQIPRTQFWARGEEEIDCIGIAVIINASLAQTTFYFAMPEKGMQSCNVLENSGLAW